MRSVTVHDARRAQPGINLVSSAHAPEAALIDMRGRVLHRWRLSFRRAWPKRTLAGDPIGTLYWRRVRILPDGGLLAVFDGYGIVRLDWDSHLVWARECDCHHDLTVGADGRIYVLSRVTRLVPQISRRNPLGEDLIDILSPEGTPLRSVSLLRAVANSPYASLLDFVAKGGDIFHTNTVRILDGTLAEELPAFARGRALVSFFWLNTVAVVDLENVVLTWALTGMWRHQHDPRLLRSGRLLLFDNSGRLGRSRVMEVDPATQAITWAYPGPEGDLDSPTSGTVQRLANGNTLITESTAGRALEVTPAGELVWEYYNPHRAGKNGRLIATLIEVERMPPDAFAERLGRQPQVSLSEPDPRPRGRYDLERDDPPGWAPAHPPS